MSNNKREGILTYDFSSERYDICFKSGHSYGGLHCGKGFEVKTGGQWLPVRIEYSWEDEDWYLVGVRRDINLLGLRVRI